MLKRYSKNSSGKLVKQADIYLVNEHGITRERIDKEALKICQKLTSRGFEAYIVGGAVRDLLLGLSPKDFDIVTNADPRQAKRACGHARIIGRRFPLVHAVSPSGHIFEVATFRSLAPDPDGNIFGNMCQDAFRRDFTMNALYYNPVNEHLIDFHQALHHIRSRRLVPIIPPVQSFNEDPVRMLRAVKYSVTTDSRISMSLGHCIKRQARLLETCSRSRLTEELNKVLRHEKVFDILRACASYGLLGYWLPEFTRELGSLPKMNQSSYWHMLRTYQQQGQKHDVDEVLIILFEDYLDRQNVLRDGCISESIQKLKEVLLPLVLPNALIQKVIERIFEQRKLHPEAHTPPPIPGGTGAFKRRRRRRSRARGHVASTSRGASA